MGPDLVVRHKTDWGAREGKGHWSERDLAEVQAKCEEFGLRFHTLMLPLDRLIGSTLGGADRHIRPTWASQAAAGAATGLVVECPWFSDPRVG